MEKQFSDTFLKTRAGKNEKKKFSSNSFLGQSGIERREKEFLPNTSNINKSALH